MITPLVSLPARIDLDDEEESRVAALHALDLIDTESEPEFDTIVALCARLIDTPFAAITFVDRARSWAKAVFGLPSIDEPRHIAFCTRAIGREEILVIPDVATDSRFEERGRFYGGHHVRFYAGAPLHAPSGARIGALCVGDTEPRSLDDASAESLGRMAMLVDALIAARATAREALLIAREGARQADRLQRQERVMHQAERLAMIGSWRLTLDDNALEWSENTYRIYGLPIGETPSLETALNCYPPHARAVIAEAMSRTIETGAGIDAEVDFVTLSGVPRRVRAIGELECVDGRPAAIVGVFQDITERYTMEQALRRSADRDELTGIANRASFNRALDAAIDTSRAEGSPLMLALVDLDGFKAINDSFGHLAGDDVLKAVGRRLEAPWLRDCFAARLGGDEFALIVHDARITDDPRGFVRRLEAELSQPVETAARTIETAGTCGIARLVAASDGPRDLVHRADLALYAAKRRRVGERRRVDRWAR